MSDDTPPSRELPPTSPTVRAPVVWLTGLSGSGKTTLAQLVALELEARGVACEVLDGDAMRANLLPELGFTKEDRDRNVRRVGYVAGLLARNGVTVLAPLVSPYRAARDELRQSLGRPFIEVHVTASLDALEERDTKGLYAKARAGELDGLTGVPPASPYRICRNSIPSGCRAEWKFAKPSRSGKRRARP